MTTDRLGDALPCWRCRWCGQSDGWVVVDLAAAPAADHFPLPSEPEDPRYPLRMVMCKGCRLAQLEEDATPPEMALGVEPLALVLQARTAVADLAAAGFARPGCRFTEFASPHGGNWAELLSSAGMVPSANELDVDEPVELVVDTLGLMHEADQRKALAERVDRLADDGVLALHIHSLASIGRTKMWNALRHGHYAYYSLPVLAAMAAEYDLVPVAAWQYPLYGGTTLVVFARSGAVGLSMSLSRTDGIRALIDSERADGVTDPSVVAHLGGVARRSAQSLRRYLDEASARGLRVAAYGAASRCIALLCLAGAGSDDIIAVADSSPGKQGRAIPGSRIPVVSPAEMVAMEPDRVLLFVPDLLAEVRSALPEVQGRGALWVLVDPEPNEVVT